MARLGLDTDGQQMGRRWAIGCVALEITQRCNLDCTACYLSEHSEAVKDLPLEAIYRRIDEIARHYGPGTDVQITGGDPTLRARDELLAIIRATRSAGLRPTLMTNGIRASAPLLRALADCGLVDVAFHVDTTQERKGYTSESALNALRLRYLRAARAAGLSVMFNTTLHTGNIEQLPALVAFFCAHADDIRTVSFNLQADTGRGVLGGRDDAFTAKTVIDGIRMGTGCALNFGSTRIGHPECTRYALAVVAGNEVRDAQADNVLVAAFHEATRDVCFDRSSMLGTVRSLFAAATRHPLTASRVAAFAGRQLWSLRKSLWAARGRVATMSFVIHDFMDANALGCERIEACVFKVMTADGPLSMCLHNARRDQQILRPLATADTNTRGTRWDPLTGADTIDVNAPTNLDPTTLPLKRLKGRSRRAALAKRNLVPHIVQ